jgi:hypothetical protein
VGKNFPLLFVVLGIDRIDSDDLMFSEMSLLACPVIPSPTTKFFTLAKKKFTIYLRIKVSNQKGYSGFGVS